MLGMEEWEEEMTRETSTLQDRVNKELEDTAPPGELKGVLGTKGSKFLNNPTKVSSF